MTNFFLRLKHQIFYYCTSKSLPQQFQLQSVKEKIIHRSRQARRTPRLGSCEKNYFYYISVISKRVLSHSERKFFFFSFFVSIAARYERAKTFLMTTKTCGARENKNLLNFSIIYFVLYPFLLVREWAEAEGGPQSA